MLMLGKMSMGVRSRTTGLMSSNTTEKTMKVYGRDNASLTIHIERSFGRLQRLSNLILR
jgi:hypothetical protein